MALNTALHLSKAFAATPAFWMNMQVKHIQIAVQEATAVSGNEPFVAD